MCAQPPRPLPRPLRPPLSLLPWPPFFPPPSATMNKHLVFGTLIMVLSIALAIVMMALNGR